MKPRSTRPLESNPCEPIQADLSCMLDGELQPAAVRRVLVHMEVCPRCQEFFMGMRRNILLHRDLRGFLGQGRDTRTAGARKERRLHLARIFYELGKAYVLLFCSPGFRREVAVEPVPIPAARLQGRDLLEDVMGADERRQPWVHAHSLLNGHLDSELDNLAKGIALLEEGLAIQPKLYEARIYLGHARNLQGDMENACEEFRIVLRSSKELPIRGYALENLGNVYLQLGELQDAARCFRRVVQGEVLAQEPRFFTSWFNLGLTYALLGYFEESLCSFGALHGGFPEKRGAVAEIVASSKDLAKAMEVNPAFGSAMRERFPEFFETR